MRKVDIRCKELYMRYAAYLMNYARRYVDDFSAEDIVHEAFLKFYGKKLLDYTDDEFQRLMYVVVKNMCIDYLRHQSCVNDYKVRNSAELTLRELINDNDEEEDIFNDESLLRRISEIVDKLPEKRQKIFKLYYCNGIEAKAISSMLQISQRTVENSVYRALQFIRKTLSESKTD